MTNKPTLISTKLKQDPRVIEGKKLIMEAIRSYQQQTIAIRPSQQELVQSYHEAIESFSRLRGANLYFPYLGSGWGNGPFVELMDGSIKYDMISGIGPHFWGHSHPPLIEASLEGALGDTIMQGHLQQNEDAYLLSQLLVQASGLDHCFLSTSGAMANENGLKLAFQNKFPADRILAFEHNFMGRTIALAQITDKPDYREGLPQTLSVDYVPFYDPENPEESIRHSVEVLKMHVSRYPHKHAMMCFEFVQGEAGFNAGTTEFFTALIKILKEHGILVFADEVQTFARTPQLFAFQHFKLENEVDIVSVGKISQVCATLFRGNLKPKAGLLSQTFTGSTCALKASRWILENLIADNFYGPAGKLQLLHERFEKNFKRLETKYPGKIRGPYGIGSMVVFTPFDGDFNQVSKFVQDLFHGGVISFVAGSNPTRVRFLIPAGVMTLEDTDAVVNIVEEVLSI